MGPALELSILGCSSTHNNILQILQRTALGPTPPKADIAYCYLYTSEIWLDDMVSFGDNLVAYCYLCTSEIWLDDVDSFGDNLVAYCYLGSSKIWPDKRGDLIREGVIVLYLLSWHISRLSIFFWCTSTSLVTGSTFY